MTSDESNNSLQTADSESVKMSAGADMSAEKARTEDNQAGGKTESRKDACTEAESGEACGCGTGSESGRPEAGGSEPDGNEAASADGEEAYSSEFEKLQPTGNYYVDESRKQLKRFLRYTRSFAYASEHNKDIDEREVYDWAKCIFIDIPLSPLYVKILLFCLAALIFPLVNARISQYDEGGITNLVLTSIKMQAGMQSTPKIGETPKLMGQVHGLLRKNFIRSLNEEEMLNGAVDGLNYTLNKFGLLDKFKFDRFQAADLETTDDAVKSIASLSFQIERTIASIEALPEADRQLKRGQFIKAVKARLAELEAQNKVAAKKRGTKDKASSAADKESKDKDAKEDAAASERDQIAADQAMLEDEDSSEVLKDDKNKPIVLDREALVYSALEGMCSATGDPFTVAMPPDEMRILNESLGASDYAGVGIYLESDFRNHRQLTVIEPIEGSPAAKSDVLPGDKIMEIDGKKTSSLDISTASAMIRGKAGTTVRLTLKRNGRSFDVSLTRTNIHVPSVGGEMRDGKIGYMRVRFFGPETTAEFRSELLKLVSGGAKGIIIDLRNNGGGYLDAAVGLVSQFIPDGKIVTSVVNPRLKIEESYKASESANLNLPLVILQNRFSASASEITAGAMTDYKRALLVGETSYGKGSVQGLEKLCDGGALKQTIAHYLTPSSKDIHLKGIAPDVKLEAMPSNRMGGSGDNQYLLAVDAMKVLMERNVHESISADDKEAVKKALQSEVKIMEAKEAKSLKEAEAIAAQEIEAEKAKRRKAKAAGSDGQK